MPQISQVADPDAVHLEAEYGVLAAQAPLLRVVIGIDAEQVHFMAYEFARADDHICIVSCRRHIVVVVMVMADGHNIGFNAGHTVAYGLLVEWVHEYDKPLIALALQKKTAMSEPPDYHNSILGARC